MSSIPKLKKTILWQLKRSFKGASTSFDSNRSSRKIATNQPKNISSVMNQPPSNITCFAFFAKIKLAYPRITGQLSFFLPTTTTLAIPYRTDFENEIFPFPSSDFVMGGGGGDSFPLARQIHRLKAGCYWMWINFRFCAKHFLHSLFWELEGAKRVKMGLAFMQVSKINKHLFLKNMHIWYTVVKPIIFINLSYVGILRSNLHVCRLIWQLGHTQV